MTILGSKEESIARLKKKRRYNLNRQLRKITEDNKGTLGIYRTLPEIEEFIAVIAPVQERTYQNKIAITVTNSALRRRTVLNHAAAGRGLCFILRIRGEIAAFQIGTVSGTSYDLEELGFDREYESLAPGMSLLYASLDELARIGVGDMNFGAGSSQYKSVLADQEENYSSVFAYARGMRPFIDGRILRVVRSLNNSVTKHLSDDFAKRTKKKARRIAELLKARGKGR